MDSQEDGNEVASPDEDEDGIPNDGNITMPEEGEIYMPQEDIIELDQYEGEIATTETYETTTEQITATTTGSVVTTSEVVETSTQEETVVYESEAVTTETEEVYQEDVSFTEEYEEVGSYEGEDAEYQEDEGSFHGEEDSVPAQEAEVDSVSDADGVRSSEASEATAIEISKVAEDELAKTEEEEVSKAADEEMEFSEGEGPRAEEERESPVEEEPPQPEEEPEAPLEEGQPQPDEEAEPPLEEGRPQPEEEPQPPVEEEPPQPEEEPPKPKEEPFKFDVVVKSEKDGVTELDVTLSKRMGLLWGFKIKGGRDLDIPPEIKAFQSCDGEMGEAIQSTVEAAKSAMEESKEMISVLQNERKWFDDATKSIEIKEAYKKVQVQVTEEYQLVEDDPTTLGVNVQKSETGEFAVIVKGRVLDDDEVAMLSVKKTSTEIQGVKTESTEVQMSREKDGDAAIEAPPSPPAIEEEKVAEKEGMVNGQGGEDKGAEPIMWVANVSTSSASPEPSSPQAGPNISPTAPSVESAPGESASIENAPAETAPTESKPAESTPAENMASSGNLKDLNLESTGAVPPASLSLKGEYQPATVEPKDKAYELVIGKVQYVKPPERPINKCYFYKPREGDMRNVRWPPKSNISNVIIKPRIIRETDVKKERGTTPVPQQPASEGTTHANAAAQQTPSPSNQMGGETVQSEPQQVTTGQEPGSLPQAAPQTDNVPNTIETKPSAEGESQVIEGTPQPSNNPESSSAAELPVPQETPVPQEPSAPQEPPALQDNPAPQEPPAPQETNVEPSAESAPPTQ